MPLTCEQIVTAIEGLFTSFLKDARKATNKAASRRARVTSLSLEKLLKQYRALSAK